jgi:WD40 repeat protein/serine/threonine protein kinase
VEPLASNLVGRRLGEFEVLERVAVGGFGEVYRAHQATLGRDAIIKVLTSAVEDIARDRFTREAQLASQLDHPYAAHIYAFGVEPDGLQWIAMELVRGISLAELLAAQGALPVSRFVPLFQAICQVVQVAHEQGIVHRDLKPANVMVVARAGVLLPKLLDFGIARLYTGDNKRSTENDERVDRLLATDRFDQQLNELLGERLAEIISTPQNQANLTSGAVYLGSPPYMAPELWLRPHSVGPPCDIYALGILAFECLTGQRPYLGETTADIARAHLQPLPSLGPAVTPALQPVLAKATAKRARERFPDALALSRAIEAVCRVDGFPVLPRPSSSLVAAVLARAPQPIAETVAAAEASTRIEDASARYLGVLELVAHYIGVLGFASWCRLGKPDPDDGVRGLVRRLCHGGLAARDWLELATVVTRPFARIRDAFPLPELVDLCHRRDVAANPTPLVSDRITARLASYDRATTDVEQLATLVATVEATLSEITELFEYDLAVRTERGYERWTGTRRRPRPLLDATADAPEGAPILFDRNRAPVLSLWPLAKAIAPTTGADLELFFVAGLGRYGARLIAQPNGFERQDPELAAWLEELAGDIERGDGDGSEARTPYRGLASFSVSDNEFFFGRERESENLANHLRTRSFAAVVGPSGAGKSSFVQAGVVPLLPADWRAVVLRPGAAPFAALREKLADIERAPPELDDLAAAIAQPTAVMTWLERDARKRGETLLVYIDQAEELVTLCRDETERGAFAQLLASARDDERIRVVLTLRDDFLMRLQRLPSLGERLTTGMQLIGTPSRADLRRILTEPARRMGYELEDTALVEEMVGAVVDNPSALALLSFTAARLWELRDRQFRKLRRRVYTSLGGVGGALAQHAEEVIVTMSDDERELVRDAFRHLVTADGTRTVILKSELSELLGGGEKAARVIESLVQARLTVTAETSGGITVEITHEALLESWPRLVTWRREDAENARLRDRLRASARQWNANGRQRGMLWRGDVLVEYRLWRGRYARRLAEIEEQFATACLREEARGKSRRRLISTTAFTVLGAVAVVLYIFAARARESASQATAKTSELMEEQGRRDLLDHHPLRAAPSLARAYTLGSKHASLRFLLASAMASVESQGPVLASHTNFVRRAVFSGDGTRVITASDDATIRLWDSSTGAELARLTTHGVPQFARSFDGEVVAAASSDDVTVWRSRDLQVLGHWDLPRGTKAASIAVADGATRVIVGDGAGVVHVLTAGGAQATTTPHKGRVAVAVISPDGQLWATGGEDGRIEIARDGAPAIVAVHGEQPVMSLAIDARGRFLASGGSDSIVRLWAADGSAVRAMPGHAKPIRSLAFARDGSLLASSSEDSTVRVWSVEAAQQPMVLGGHEGTVFSVVFDATGRRIASAGADGTVRLWDVASAAPLAALDAHRAEAWFADFDPAGNRIASAGFDRTARIWNLGRRDDRLPIPKPKGGFSAAMFDGSGSRIVTAAFDGNSRIFDLSGKEDGMLLGFDGPLRTAAISPDASHAVTGSESGTARLWDPERLGVLAVLESGKGGVYIARFRPDGRQAATGGDDGVVRVFDSTTGKLIRRLEGHTAAVWGLAYSSDGGLLASASDDRTIRLWETETGKLVRSIGPLASEVNGVAFDPDGRRLAAVGSDGMLHVFQVADGALLGEVAAHHDNATVVAFSSDGERIVTAGYDRTVNVWDAGSLRELAQLRRHTDAILAVAFQPHSDRLLSAGVDGAIWLTDLALEKRSADDINRIIAAQR